MEQLMEVLQEIRDGIYTMNSNIEELKVAIQEIKGEGLFNSLTDVCGKLDSLGSDIKGDGLYDNLTDVCNKLAEISSTLSTIEINTM